LFAGTIAGHRFVSNPTTIPEASAKERQKNVEGEASVLIGVAANATFRQQEMNPAFVLMEYFGYLRRDPNALPDADPSGHNFWLSKLNQFGGNYLDAEMIKAFITSFEYRTRFGQ
jgi:hypothetical protein